ncbi:hypothetical protein TrST_g265 [Triparma strigata]|uniref:HTTM domain-containing protein n=1 Tax=Triparma strigata TaxID=1606541 RepID=A0A9W7A5A6_9STRA|nr:hypothetical protein TrST_g265 [Triparma strigata]
MIADSTWTVSTLRASLDDLNINWNHKCKKKDLIILYNNHHEKETEKERYISVDDSNISSSNISSSNILSGINLFHKSLYILLTYELLTRIYYVDAFYGNESTHPIDILLNEDKIDSSFYYVSYLHIISSFSSVNFTGLLLLQSLLSFLTIIKPSPILCTLNWYLYLSLTLRNTWLSYILDRYFHYFLFLSIFTSSKNVQIRKAGAWAARLQIMWIYFDAGLGKVSDPLRGWTTEPVQIEGMTILPALDSYTRHNLPARIMYTLLTPTGLKYLTPVVAWAEVVLPFLSLLCSFFRLPSLQKTSAFLLMGLHLGIGLTINNTALLSLVACSTLLLLLPLSLPPSSFHPPSVLLLLLAFTSCLYFETSSLSTCSQSTSLLPTLLHNRWNVFTSSETYVTWEIAPALLSDSSIIDAWSGGKVSYEIPGSGAGSTTTPRRGRYRSFPYLKDFKSQRSKSSLWNYLCHEFEENNDDLKIVKYNFFMLQSSVLPNLAFGPTSKRRIISWDCGKGEEIVGEDSEEGYQFKNKDEKTMRAREEFNKRHQETVKPNKVRTRGTVNEEL